MPTGSASARRASTELTRQSLVRAVLALLADHSLDAVSLRQVAAQAGVTPAAFYRHYEGLEALGLDLVEEAFRSLGQAMQRVGAQLASEENALERALDVVARYRDDQAPHLRFVVRERDGGLRRVRRAIERQLRLMTDELAVDLAAVLALSGWSMEDRRALAGLVTEAMLRLGAELLEADAEERETTLARTGHRLRLLGLGDMAQRDGPHSGSADQSMDGR